MSKNSQSDWDHRRKHVYTRMTCSHNFSARMPACWENDSLSQVNYEKKTKKACYTVQRQKNRTGSTERSHNALNNAKKKKKRKRTYAHTCMELKGKSDKFFLD